MISLYHCVSARSFRPLWTLHELGIAHELIILPFPPRAYARSYLEINPLGTVPLLLDGAVRMTESAAICQYLCAISAPTPLQIEPGETGFGAYLNYLHFGEATLTFPQTLVLRYGRFEPENRRQPTVVADYSKWFLARLRSLEPFLAEHAYLCADRFTAADISVGYALMLADYLGLADQFGPQTLAYWQRLQARDGFKGALRAQDVAARAQGVSPVPAPLLTPVS